MRSRHATRTRGTRLRTQCVQAAPSAPRTSTSGRTAAGRLIQSVDLAALVGSASTWFQTAAFFRTLFAPPALNAKMACNMLSFDAWDQSIMLIHLSAQLIILTVWEISFEILFVRTAQFVRKISTRCPVVIRTLGMYPMTEFARIARSARETTRMLLPCVPRFRILFA